MSDINPMKLGELFTFKNGRAFKKTEWSETGLPIIRIKNLNDSDAGFNYFEGDYDRAIEVNEGDLLFSWSGTVGSSFGPHIWSRKKGVLNQHIFKIGYQKPIVRDYAYYALAEITSEIEKSVNGAVGLVHVTKADLNQFEIPVPPLAEQERIVGILDEAFEGIAAATAQAEKNLHNARELFQSVLQSTFSQKGDDWVEAELDEITESTQIGLVRNKKSQGEDLPYRYVKMNNIGNDNTYNETDMVSVNADAIEVEKFSLRKGDLLFNTRNSHELVGKSCIYQSDSDSIALYNNNIMRIRFLENIKEEFAAFAFSSKQAVDQLDSMVSGTTNVAAIYYKSLRHLKIPVPPLPTQQAIVEKLDALLEETKRLEAIYERKQAALSELKQSLLQKAFAGEL